MSEPIKIIDAATPWIQGMIAGAPDWQRKAMKSAGWMMQQEIKRGIRSGAPGGRRYAAGVGSKMRREIDEIMSLRRQSREPKSRYNLLGKLPNAVVYQYKDGQVVVGWASKSAVRIGTWMEKGVDQPVTPPMRRMLLSAGVFLNEDTTRIVIPPRPTYDPMAQVLEPKVAPWIEQKLIEYAESGAPIAKSGGRKYKVFRSGLGASY